MRYPDRYPLTPWSVALTDLRGVGLYGDIVTKLDDHCTLMGLKVKDDAGEVCGLVGLRVRDGEPVASLVRGWDESSAQADGDMGGD